MVAVMNEVEDIDRTVETNENAVSPEVKPKRRSRTRRVGSFLWFLVMLVVFICVGTYLGGLVRYVSVVTKPAMPLSAPVDGIVVLTGGENRIKTAFKLLRSGEAEKLFITGVNPEIGDETIKKLAGADQALFNCCVEIDRTAKDTIGNALATAKWTADNDVKSVVLVTGAFHMPRARIEMSHGSPDVRFSGHPVNVPKQSEWLEGNGRLRDMLREYTKLSVIVVRDHLNEFMGWPWPTLPMRDALNEARS